jgi:hypothetical protein
LSVLPVLVTWQAFAAHGWTSGTGKPLVAGTVAMLASLAVIVLHHLGHRGFQNRAALAPVIVGWGLLSLAYLLTASPCTPRSPCAAPRCPHMPPGCPHRAPRPPTASSQDGHAGPIASTSSSS